MNNDCTNTSKHSFCLKFKGQNLSLKLFSCRKKGFIFPTSLHNVLLPSPSPSRLVSFFSFFSLHAWSCSRTRPMLGGWIGPGHSCCFAVSQQVKPQKPTQTFSLGWVFLILSHTMLHLPPHTQTHTHTDFRVVSFFATTRTLKFSHNN